MTRATGGQGAYVIAEGLRSEGDAKDWVSKAIGEITNGTYGDVVKIETFS